MIALFVTAVIVGTLIGSVGVGGILLIPALNLLTALSLQESMATALATFIFTGVVGTYLFQRRGSIDWSLTMPLCTGAALFGFIGAWASSLLDTRMLMQALAAVILVAGFYTLLSRGSQRTAAFADRPLAQRALLFGIGAATGFGSGLTGVGGPALSVPIMVLLGFPALSAIGASQVVQIVAALSGSVGHLAHGNIDIPLAALLTVFEVIGVWCGVFAAHAVDGRYLRKAVGALCMLVGIGLVIRSVTHDTPPPVSKPPLVSGPSHGRAVEAVAIGSSSSVLRKQPSASGSR